MCCSSMTAGVTTSVARSFRLGGFPTRPSDGPNFRAWREPQAYIQASWATGRELLPPNDVAAAGGWLETATHQFYQVCDLDPSAVFQFEGPSRQRECG
jgi:hypothetical protein